MNLSDYAIFSDSSHPGLPTDTPSGVETLKRGFIFGNLLDTRQFVWVILAIFIFLMIKK